MVNANVQRGRGGTNRQFVFITGRTARATCMQEMVRIAPLCWKEFWEQLRYHEETAPPISQTSPPGISKMQSSSQSTRTNSSWTARISVAAFLVSLHVAPDTKVLAATFVLTFVRLLAGVGVDVDLE
jgi:hypothetical protein